MIATTLKPLIMADWQESVGDSIDELDRPDPWWRVWALALAAFKGFKVVKCKTPGSFYDGLVVNDPKPHQEVHVYAHGWPGGPVIGGETIKASHAAWDCLRGSTVWFRACDVGMGTEGRDFVNALASRGINVACHLGNIGAMGHSFLVGVRAGETAWWPRNFDGGSSGLFKSRTVLPTDVRLPTWAFSRMPPLEK